ncbi:MAG: rhodanese-like domain-containing protein [Acidiferrobacterales bacterium]
MTRQLTVQELETWQVQPERRATIVDVREPWEIQICAISGSRHIPMRQIPASLAELPKGDEIVVLCHHGQRSQQVADFLTRQGYVNVYSLVGGIDAWAREIDSTMTRY